MELETWSHCPRVSQHHSRRPASGDAAGGADHFTHVREYASRDGPVRSTKPRMASPVAAALCRCLAPAAGSPNHPRSKCSAAAFSAAGETRPVRARLRKPGDRRDVIHKISPQRLTVLADRDLRHGGSEGARLCRSRSGGHRSPLVGLRGSVASIV